MCLCLWCPMENICKSGSPWCSLRMFACRCFITCLEDNWNICCIVYWVLMTKCPFITYLYNFFEEMLGNITSASECGLCSLFIYSSFLARVGEHMVLSLFWLRYYFFFLDCLSGINPCLFMCRLMERTCSFLVHVDYWTITPIYSLQNNKYKYDKK